MSELKPFDAVVMLTWSDWFTEMRSNRYHYAVRFAENSQVIFVQPDETSDDYRFENTEIENIVVLHVSQNYEKATYQINKALHTRKIVRPLLWIYNAYFIEFIRTRYSVTKIYHATEDYFSDSVMCGTQDTVLQLRTLISETVKQCDLLVCVSKGVYTSYKYNCEYSGKYITLENGCDYDFFEADTLNSIEQYNSTKSKTLFYQGGISQKLDVGLLSEIVKQLPSWKLVICGKIFNAPDGWERLIALKNVDYLGCLSPDDVKQQAYQSDIGLIPFIQNDWITNRSFPLKAFEYVAGGLPVVTVPIKSLQSYPDVFCFAKTANEFVVAIKELSLSRYEKDKIFYRLQQAKAHSYSDKFTILSSTITRLIDSKPNHNEAMHDVKMSVLILYGEDSVHVNTLREHLESFGRYSQHRVCYYSATGSRECVVDLNQYDAVVIHYSIRLSIRDHLSSSIAEGLQCYGGYKIAFIQDEYDTPETTRQWLEQLGIHAVFTCVPEKYIHTIYPRKRFVHTTFIPTLTGYVPEQFVNQEGFNALEDREFHIGYRGRELPYWYGELGREKLEIGKRMKAICDQKRILTDIAWTADARIYGPKWYAFLANCRATLGTESGANVFDDYGIIKYAIETELEHNPDLSYETAAERWIKPHEGLIKMNQISPKIFEAIALRTALILFEGEYSDVIEPNKHYIPLKKDFSNVDDVLAKLEDVDYLTKLTTQAYQDIVLSGKYSYKNFITHFDQQLMESISPSTCRSPMIFPMEMSQNLQVRVQVLETEIAALKTELLCAKQTVVTNVETLQKSRFSFYKSAIRFCLRLIPRPVKTALKTIYFKLPVIVKKPIRFVMLPILKRV